MSKKAKRSRSRLPPPPRGRGKWAILAGAILLVALLAWSFRPEHPPVPEITPSHLSSEQQQTIQKYRAEVDANPRSGKAWGVYGMVLWSFDFDREALRCFRAAESLDPANPRWPYFISRLVEAENPRESIASLERSVRLAGNDPEAPRYLLARGLAETGRFDEAEKEATALLAAKPDFAPARLILSRTALARGNLEQAAELAALCLDDSRARKAAWLQKAAILRRQGDLEGAAEAVARSASLPADEPVYNAFEAEAAAYRGDPRLLGNRIHPLLANRELSEASPLVRRLIQEHPEFPDTWLLNGRLLFLQNNFAAAEASLRKYIEMEPRSTHGYFHLGMVHLSAKEFKKAVPAFQKATQLKPDFGPAWYNLGYARGLAGNFPQATTAFREAIRHNPEHVMSYLLLADILIRQNEKSEAAKLLEQAELIDPGDSRIQALRQKL